VLNNDTYTTHLIFSLYSYKCCWLKTPLLFYICDTLNFYIGDPFFQHEMMSHVSIHESGSAFSKSMEFCKKNHHTIINNGCTLSVHAT